MSGGRKRGGGFFIRTSVAHVPSDAWWAAITAAESARPPRVEPRVDVFSGLAWACSRSRLDVVSCSSTLKIEVSEGECDGRTGGGARKRRVVP